MIQLLADPVQHDAIEKKRRRATEELYGPVEVKKASGAPTMGSGVPFFDPTLQGKQQDYEPGVIEKRLMVTSAFTPIARLLRWFPGG